MDKLWLKRVLIPFWVVQIIVNVILLIIMAFAIGVILEHDNYINDLYDEEYGSGSYRAVRRAVNAVAAIYLAFTSFTLLTVIIEIVQLGRHVLSPVLVVTLNTLCTLMWGVLLILALIGTANGGSGLAFVFLILTLATSLGKLIYGSVVLHRYRKERAGARGVYQGTSAQMEDGYEPARTLDTSYHGSANMVPTPNPFRDRSRDSSPATNQYEMSQRQ